MASPPQTRPAGRSRRVTARAAGSPATLAPGRRGNHRTRPWASLALAAAAVGAGVVTVFIGPFEYRCTIDYGVRGEPCDVTSLANYRRELIEHLMPPGANTGNGPTAVTRWTATLRPESCSLRHAFLAPSVREGQIRLAKLARSYPDHLRRVAEQALSTPSEAEAMLAQRLADLRAERDALTGTGARPDVLGGADDPLQDTGSAAASLQAERAGYDSLRNRLTGLVRERSDLQQTPVPPTVPVDPEIRRAALEADSTWSHDRKEMQVHLAEMRARLLDVYDVSLPGLRAVAASAEAIQQLGETKAARSATGVHRVAAERLVEAANAYQRLLTRFAGGWRREFNALREDTSQPPGPAIIETQDRLARLLGDVLFETVEPLSTMKDQVDAMASDPNDAARHHELITLATRQFNALRTAHHQFEFTASDIKALNNPRLDAALRSARALHHRTQQRTREIDQGLQAEARRVAVEERERRIAELEEQIDRLRPEIDRTVAAMLSAQDLLTQAVPRIEDFLQQQFDAERTAGRLRAVETEIADTQARLDVLAASRSAPVDPSAVMVLERHVEPQPVNLVQRLASGWLVTATALVVILLVQGIVSARRSS